MVVDPLREILRSSQNGFIWTEAADASFQELKQLLVHSPALALFDPTLPTVMSTDTSDYGIGGVITQLHPDQTERPKAFASRTLTPAKRKYSTVEKEALASLVCLDSRTLEDLPLGQEVYTEDGPPRADHITGHQRNEQSRNEDSSLVNQTPLFQLQSGVQTR